MGRWQHRIRNSRIPGESLISAMSSVNLCFHTISLRTLFSRLGLSLTGELRKTARVISYVFVSQRIYRMYEYRPKTLRMPLNLSEQARNRQQHRKVSHGPEYLYKNEAPKQRACQFIIDTENHIQSRLNCTRNTESFNTLLYPEEYMAVSLWYFFPFHQDVHCILPTVQLWTRYHWLALLSTRALRSCNKYKQPLWLSLLFL